MLVGCHFNDLPEETQELEDIYEFAEDNGLITASEWYDAGTEGMYIGIEVSSEIEEAKLDEFIIDVKLAFVKAKDVLKVQPTLISTQDIW